ncbi:DUF1854 domain-containing protein [bacterium]|jgi:hypothetical protein|nr:DUF1854 domain-containing protein [bacterium]MDF1784828.1 DUF1854 domain-containing protein [Verrucomicrobiales bacterium]
MKVRLHKEADSMMASIDGGEEIAVRLVYARPISAPSGQISIMDVKGKEELAWLDSLQDLDSESLSLAESELWKTYRISKVSRITESYVNHGHRYLRVETDRGNRYFSLREPGKNISRLSDDHLIVRDSMGNRYEIESIAGLDADSRLNLERVL